MREWMNECCWVHKPWHHICPINWECRQTDNKLNYFSDCRVGQPEECAGAVAFLVSDDASYITGENMVIAGGQPSRMWAASAPCTKEQWNRTWPVLEYNNFMRLLYSWQFFCVTFCSSCLCFLKCILWIKKHSVQSKIF